MLKWLKNAWPWKSKSMTPAEIITSWANFSNEPKAPIWDKDFKANDVKKALDKQAPKPTLKKATTRTKSMPLKKSTSKAAFKANVKEEAKTKPIKQAVAIAYAVKKTATKKGSKK